MKNQNVSEVLTVVNAGLKAELIGTSNGLTTFKKRGEYHIQISGVDYSTVDKRLYAKKLATFIDRHEMFLL